MYKHCEYDKVHVNMPMEPSIVDGILIRSMTADDYKDVKPFLGKNLYPYEPLCMNAGRDIQKVCEKEQDDRHMSLIEQDTCLVAIDKNNNDRLVGIVLAGAMVPSDLEKSLIDGDIYVKQIEDFCSFIENKANVFKLFGVSKALLSYMTAVEVSMRGKGLGTRLAATLMDVGRSKGFPLMTADCTSYYSARQKEAMGMKCVYSIAYADYKNDQGEVVFKPPPPHTHARVVAITL